ncbi:MAG: 1-deoxy-D-xylulose 5-phosphate reductoisomerase, partial [Chloroflexi bacterium]|nr:1-deoxy-D-xylulose 5-phosphate reductoisomerase [Chloroflexota bacterium]
MVAGHDPGALDAVVRRFGVPRSAVVDPPPGAVLPEGCAVGLEAACEIAALDADVVCVGISGAAALRPTLAALEAGTDVA